MILPNKYVTLPESYIGISALILETLSSQKLTIDALWNKFEKMHIKSKRIKIAPSYQKFIFVLEFMYMCEMLSFNEKGEILNENIESTN